jgi:LEA14-like dessication related protein
VKPHQVLAVAAVVLGIGCTKPEPPRITPKAVAVTGVNTEGLELAAKLSVANPNGFDLSAKSVKAKVVVGRTVDLGVVNVDKAFTLPAGAAADLDVPIVLNWQSAAPLVPLAQQPEVPFTVDGTVEIGGRLAVSVPFHLDGVLKREQLLKAAAVRLPFQLPL